jgi:hypothetical protein
MATNAWATGWGLLSRVGPSLESYHSRLGFEECLVRLSHTLAQGQGIALHNVVHEVKEIGHTQALEAMFGELDERLGPVTHQV